MAKKSARARAARRPARRAKQIKDLVNEGVAVQVELLGAAVQVWSTMFESMAAYTKTASEELINLSASGDANAAVDRVAGVARRKLDQLERLPGEIGRSFEKKVRARVKR